jgi:arylsulfatase A-like enzyme
MKQNQNRPFFLYLSHDAPHWPFESRPETLARFEAKKKNNAKDRADYAAMISDADTAIGLFLDSLEELGLAENTVIFFTSDNGGSMEYTINDPLRGGKGRPHEGGVRVPMIVRWPGNIPAGSTNDTAVIGTDLYPTFLSLAGVAKPDSLILDGADISPLLREEAIADRSIFWHCPAYNVFRTAPHSVIRHGNHKLIHWYENGESELFDLTEARPERNDLAAENPEAHNQLITKLNSWQKEIKAKEPAPNPNYKAAE